MKRVCIGQCGRLKREKIAEYVELHAKTWPGVLQTISACNIENYSIFLQDDLVFSYYEYVGGDYDADMEKMARDEVTQEWWKVTKPCFERFAFSEDSECYHDMKQIFYHA